MIALGIDPGTRRAGYGLISLERGQATFLDAGLLKVRGVSDAEVLKELAAELRIIIHKYHPDVVGIEKLFFSRNQKTGLAVAQARGAILATLSETNLPLKEFSPSEIKLMTTGYGSSDKKAVAKMVRLLLRTPELKLIDDAMDALAIAWCAAQQNLKKIPN